MAQTPVSTYATAMNAHLDKIEAGLTGVSGDVTSLNDLIAQLQSTSGAITAEDQGLLDQMQARGKALSDRLEALDALTPPVAPPSPSTSDGTVNPI